MSSEREDDERFVLVSAVQKLETLFNKCDTDHNKMMDFNELRNALKMLYLPCSEREMDTLFGGGDGHPKGLTEQTFARYCFHAEQHLWDIYKNELDEDGDGCISLREFRRSFRVLGWRLSDAEIEQLFQKLDVGKDGTLNYSEWRRLMGNIPPEGKAWVDCFWRNRLASEGTSADNLRPVRQRGESRTIDILAGHPTNLPIPPNSPTLPNP